MSQGPPPDGGGGVVVPWDHCWFVAPVQAHSWTLVPLAVPRALASRHSPDCTPVMVPSVLRFHCWLVWPLQSQMMAAVSVLVPRPLASMLLLPYTVSCLPLV